MQGLQVAYMTMHRILVVEDDPHIVRAIAPALSVSGFSPDHSRTLADARERIASEGWDAAVVDLGLPDGDGYQLAELLRSKGTPFVIITARTDPEEERRTLDAGAAGFLRKPFSSADLVRLLESLL